MVVVEEELLLALLEQVVMVRAVQVEVVLALLVILPLELLEQPILAVVVVEPEEEIPTLEVLAVQVL
jgi:hypothetical protein